MPSASRALKTIAAHTIEFLPLFGFAARGEPQTTIPYIQNYLKESALAGEQLRKRPPRPNSLEANYLDLLTAASLINHAGDFVAFPAPSRFSYLVSDFAWNVG